MQVRTGRPPFSSSSLSSGADQRSFDGVLTPPFLLEERMREITIRELSIEHGWTGLAIGAALWWGEYCEVYKPRR